MNQFWANQRLYFKWSQASRISVLFHVRQLNVGNLEGGIVVKGYGICGYGLGTGDRLSAHDGQEATIMMTEEC